MIGRDRDRSGPAVPRALTTAGLVLFFAACGAGYGGYGADGEARPGAGSDADGTDEIKVSNEPCEPRGQNEVGAAFDAAALAGTWSLRMFADHGEAAGSSASGRLVLEAYAADEAPLVGGRPASAHGFANVDLESVGAASSGDPASRAPDRPGVLVLQASGATDSLSRVTLRLGDRSNRLDRVAFDDAYNALHLTSAGQDAFAGRWESGTARGAIAGGRFCAVRTGEPG